SGAPDGALPASRERENERTGYEGVPVRSYRSTANAGCPRPGRITSRSSWTARESYGGRRASTRQADVAGAKPTSASRTCGPIARAPIGVVATIVTPSGSARSRTPPSTFDSSDPAEVHSSTYGYVGASGTSPK